MPTNHDHDQDGGLAVDLPRLVTRRRLLALASGAGMAAVLAACDSGGSPEAATARSTTGSTAGTTGSTTTGSTAGSTGTTGATAAGATASATCDPLPEETAGPFPGDGSNGPDILAESGVVRSDIRSSIGSASGVAGGIPLTIEMTVTDTTAGCAPMAGAAVYVWHCDREGRYSMYSGGAEDENYLRGVQEADADGRVTFTSIFPACYQGRWPHVHFEVYADVGAATSGGEPLATSQLAFPVDVCTVAYATAGYEASVRSLADVTLESDNVFSDGSGQQVATVTGDPSAGYVAVLAVPV